MADVARSVLAGVVVVLGVVFGEPAAKVFKPLVDVLTQGLNIVIQLFDALPQPMQTALVGMTAAGGMATPADWAERSAITTQPVTEVSLRPVRAGGPLSLSSAISLPTSTI